MSTHTNPLPLVRLTMTLRTDADLSHLLDCLQDVCVYEVADAVMGAGDDCSCVSPNNTQPRPRGAASVCGDSIECSAEAVNETPAPAPAPTFSAAPPPGTHAVLALREIVRARNYHRTHGIYPPGTVDDLFDTWAADLAERALGGEA